MRHTNDALDETGFTVSRRALDADHSVPIGSFKDNEGYGTTKGIQIFDLQTEFFGDGLHNEDGTIPPLTY